MRLNMNSKMHGEDTSMCTVGNLLQIPFLSLLMHSLNWD